MLTIGLASLQRENDFVHIRKGSDLRTQERRDAPLLIIDTIQLPIPQPLEFSFATTTHFSRALTFAHSLLTYPLIQRATLRMKLNETTAR
jgi:hypothetical protein